MCIEVIEWLQIKSENDFEDVSSELKIKERKLQRVNKTNKDLYTRLADIKLKNVSLCVSTIVLTT